METNDTSGVRILPPLVYFTGLTAGLLLDRVWPVRIVPPAMGPVLGVAGWVLVAIGLLLPISAVILFRRAGTSPVPTRPTTALAFGGPYRFTRNPMYLGLALVQAGVGLIANALLPVVFLAPVLFVIRRYVIDREERYLERKFGESYLSYKRRVRRWL
jgi:protein-S-isoprenylcysteine O-methyltransferase Ste14